MARTQQKHLKAPLVWKVLAIPKQFKRDASEFLQSLRNQGAKLKYIRNKSRDGSNIHVGYYMVAGVS